MTDPNFTVIDQTWGSYWLHKDGRHFISFYPATEVRGAHFQAYTSKAKPPKGRYPWTVDNRRLGRDGYGFQTFEAAAAAVAEVATA